MSLTEALLTHVSVIGVCGILGNIQLFRILCRLLATRRMAARVLAVWLATSGFVGCELSWLLSPFMCEPVSPPHIVARLYAETNFYEYTWRALRTLLGAQRSSAADPVARAACPCPHTIAEIDRNTGWQPMPLFCSIRNTRRTHL